MLARLRIGPKLLLAPGVVLVLLVLLSACSYYAMVRQNDSLDSIVERRAANMRAAADLSASARTAHAQAYQVLTWISGSFPRFRIDPLAQDLQARQVAVDGGLARLARQTADSPDEQRYVDQARAAWAQYVPAVRDVIEIARIDQSISANAMVKAERAFAVVAQRLAELARREQALSEQASAEADDDFRLIAILMPVVIALSIAAALVITMAVRRALLAEIGAIGAAANGLASGDLTIRARAYGDDEIAQTARLLDAGIRGLNGQLRTVLDSARSIGAASREITLGRAGMPPRAHVREAMERATASMQALADALGDSAASGSRADALAARAGQVAEEGNGMVHRVVATMGQVRRAAVRMERIGAAIEGTLARAGSVAGNADGGAREARALARRAYHAAREARTLARATVAAIDDGGACALDAGASMAGLAGAVEDMAHIVDGMGSEGSKRAHELADATQAIVRMDELTQQGSRMVEEAALAARVLQQQALGLARTVAAFRLDEAVQGANETAPPGTHALRPGRAGRPYLRLASSRGKSR
ncbi:MCP four helix bundle domain-containing protein [Massilia luteola]|uniref:MCP four helix bundle domain-containing protein n=1 Tax=Massilia luteola TaxID=3081751 RepID=UPI002ACC10F3|nr:MCP four helix bundle domain-containing protein [Massilia sp. Gc5]